MSAALLRAAVLVFLTTSTLARTLPPANFTLVTEIHLEKCGQLVEELAEGHIRMFVDLTALKDRSIHRILDQIQVIVDEHADHRMKTMVARIMASARREVATRDEQLDELLATPGRSQRDVLGLVGMAVGLYNTYEITQLGKTQNTLIHDVARDHIKLTTLWNHERLVDSHLQNLTNTIFRMRRESEMVLLSEYISALVRMDGQTVDGILRMVDSARNGHPSLALVQSASVQKALRGLEREAQKRGLKPISSDLASLVRARSSVLIDRIGVWVLIHVPLVDSVPPHDLFQLAPFVWHRDNRTEEIAADKNVLAVAHDGWFAEVTSDQLAKCEPWRPVILCRPLTWVKTTAESCLASLWKGEMAAAARTCARMPVRAQDLVRPLRGGFFAVTLTDATQISVTCDDGRVLIQPIAAGTYNASVGPGCQMRLGGTKTRSQTKLPDIAVELTLDPALTWTTNISLADLDLTDPLTPTQPLERLEVWNEDWVLPQEVHLSGLAIGAGGFLLASSIMTFLCIRYRLWKRASAQTAKASTPAPEA